MEVIEHRHAFAIFSDDPKSTSVALKSIFDRHDQPLLTVNGTQSQKEYLGQSLSHTLIDLSAGVDFDALSCIVAAVQGGSILIFLFDQKPIMTHRAYLRLIRIIKEHMPHFQSHQQQDWIDLIGKIFMQSKAHAINPHPLATNSTDSLENLAYQYAIHDDQAKMILKIYHSFKSQSKKQIALIAARGRGKSASIGIAIALLLLSGEALIYLSAQDENQIQAVLVHAKRVLEKRVLESLISKDKSDDHVSERLFKTVFHVAHQKVIFVPANALVFLPKNQKVKLIIDEASAIDLSILEKLSVHQILYSSTVGGYEGNGRTLALKFLPKLKNLEKYTLTQPIRWAIDDPVENMMSRHFLMDSEIYHQVNQDLVIDQNIQLSYQRLDRDALAQDEQRLVACFSLLMQAHYQTTPNDLWYLLDAPNFHIDILENSSDRQILAVALIAKEGGLSETDQRSLYLDLARPRGQVLASNFAVHLAQPALTQIHMWRIVRIAVLPSAQNQGLGSTLVQQIKAKAKAEGIGLMGAVFSAHSKVMRFWHHQDFHALRLSLRPNANSATHSVLMVNPILENLDQTAIHQLQSLQSQSIHRFIHQLSEMEQVLSMDLIFSYLKCTSQDLQEIAYQDALQRLRNLSDHDWAFLMATAYIGRSYELNVSASFQLVLCWLLDPCRLKIEPEIEAQYLIAKVIQKRSLETVIQDLQVSVPREIMKGISRCFQALIEIYAPMHILEELKKIK